MSKADHLGEFQQLVLFTLVDLGDEAYGARIRQELEHRSGRPVSVGAVYTTLDRLEIKGFVASRLGEPTPQRGGRAKRYFWVTASGVATLQKCRQTLQSLGAFTPEVAR